MFAVAAMLKKYLLPDSSHELASRFGPVFRLQICKLFKYYEHLFSLFRTARFQFLLTDSSAHHPDKLTTGMTAWNATKGQPVYEERKDFGLKPIGVLNQDPETCLLFCLVVRRLDKDRKARFGGGVVNRNAGLLLLRFSQHCFKCRKWSCNMLNMQDAALSAIPAGRCSTPILT